MFLLVVVVVVFSAMHAVLVAECIVLFGLFALVCVLTPSLSLHLLFCPNVSVGVLACSDLLVLFVSDQSSYSHVTGCCY